MKYKCLWLALIGFFLSVSAVASQSQSPLNVKPHVQSVRDWGSYTFPKTQLGETKDTFTFTYPGSIYAQRIYSLTFDDPINFSVTSNNCDGQTPQCTFTVAFTPHSNGTVSSGLKVIGTYTYLGPNSSGPEPTEDHWQLVGPCVADPIRNEVCAKGSVIGGSAGTLAESIPLTGIPFQLVYSSRMTPDYMDIDGLSSLIDGLNPEGWMPSIQHFYVRTRELVYNGDGSTSGLPFTGVSGQPDEVLSDDGSEIYLFDAATGRHLETRTSLTKALVYSFAYDTSGKLTAVQDASGNVTSFHRNSSGQLTDIQGPYGQTTLIGLNSAGLISSVQNPKGEIYSLTYKAGTKLLETFQKPGQQVTTLTYDSSGHLLKDLGNAGNFTARSSTSQSGVVTTNLSTKLGFVTSLQTSRAQDSSLVRTETYPDANVNTHTEAQNYTKDIDHNHAVLTKFVDDERFGARRNRISSVTVTYGGVQKLTTYSQQVTWPSGVTATPYNFASLTKQTVSGANAVTWAYDASTKVATTTTAAGATNSVTMDNQERVVQAQTGSDTPWTYTYDSHGRLQSSAQGSHNGSTNVYDNNGFLASTTNARNETTSYTYDLAGRRTQVVLPDQRAVNYSYDANGNLTGVTPPNRPIHAFTYNSAELTNAYQPPSIGAGIAKDTIYTYDGDNRLANIARPDGSNITYNYDPTTGQLTGITTAAGSYVYTYSTVTQMLIKRKAPSGVRDELTFKGQLLLSDSQISSTNFLFGIVSFAYDNFHRKISRTIQGNSTTNSSTINYAYNNDDRLTQAGDLSLTYSYPSGRLETTTIGRISDIRTYDAYGNLASYNVTDTPSGGSPTSLYSYTLTRDVAGRISSKTETFQGVTSTYDYGFDLAGRLTQVKKNGQVTTTFNYDDNGNRTSGMLEGVPFTATYDNQDRIQSWNTNTYSFNQNGELSQIQRSPGGTTSFTYDSMGNRTQVTAGSTVYTYVSDGFDRLSGKRSGSTWNYRLLYEDQLHLAAEVSNTGVIQREFVNATGTNSFDYFIVGANKYRIIADHLGSTRLVVNVSTGVVSEAIAYNVIGGVISDTNPGFVAQNFAGGILDANTKMIRFGARDYDPETGRWTSKDPIRFAGGDANLYGYVLNDPVSLIDPSGLGAEGALLRTIVDVIGGIGLEIGGALMCPKAQPQNDPKTCQKAADAGRMGCNSMKPGPAQNDCHTRVTLEYNKCMGWI